MLINEYADVRPTKLIRPDEVYAVDELRHRFGWSEATLRRMRREGMPVRYLGRMCFVKGRDLIHHIEKFGKQSR